MIPEQIATGIDGGLAGERGLRNALAVMDSDVDRVIVQADEHVVDRTIRYDEETKRFKLRRQAYQVKRLSDE